MTEHHGALSEGRVCALQRCKISGAQPLPDAWQTKQLAKPERAVGPQAIQYGQLRDVLDAEARASPRARRSRLLTTAAKRSAAACCIDRILKARQVYQRFT